MVTLLVNYLSLMASIGKIRSVSQRVRSRNLTIYMNESQGEFADNLNLLADSIYKCGQAFADLSGKTELILKDAKTAFMQADESAAGQFKR